MKASTFIKVALLEQMQQIADLGLWFHLAKLLPSGIEVLARVRVFNWNDGNVPESEDIESAVNVIYYALFPPEYEFYPTSKDFFSKLPPANSDKMFIWLTSEEGDAEKHLQIIVRALVVTSHYPPPQMYVHVPKWFADFKSACQIVLEEIKFDELEDIEIFPELNEQ